MLGSWIWFEGWASRVSCLFRGGGGSLGVGRARERRVENDSKALGLSNQKAEVGVKGSGEWWGSKFG